MKHYVNVYSKYRIEHFFFQIRLGQLHLDQIMRAVLPYLSARQPKMLQQVKTEFTLFFQLE